MKPVVGGYYQDGRCKHRVIMHVKKIEVNLAWGDMYFVDEGEPCALLDCGIKKSRLIYTPYESDIAIAKQMERKFEEWRKQK
ncbi:hypothetical protein C8U37_107132 [Trichococcus patagoniensis]|uniref:Uncharacterized protein n=1 Tax=Trichococcus patagoniensis TaxID=382641 RepID=A0A2T5ILR3_9LACT|nr:hypothetical protein [Trichococcus patagoniensis]PTQ84764.1 hypothetical protein C8U37_107132 [Trichococcus patagoniensis]